MTEDEKIEATLRMIDEGRVPEGFKPLYELFLPDWQGDGWRWDVVERLEFENPRGDYLGHKPSRRIIFTFEPVA